MLVVSTNISEPQAGCLDLGPAVPPFQHGPAKTLGCYFLFLVSYLGERNIGESLFSLRHGKRRESKDSQNKDHTSRGTILSPIEQVTRTGSARFVIDYDACADATDSRQKSVWLSDFFNLDPEDVDWAARWNVAPTQEVATVLQDRKEPKRKFASA
jgi:hypothetical protein